MGKQESAMSASSNLLKASQELAQKSPLVRRRTISRDRMVGQLGNRDISEERGLVGSRRVSGTETAMASARKISGTETALASTRKISGSSLQGASSSMAVSSSRSESASMKTSSHMQSTSTMEASAHSEEVAEITSRMESASMQASSSMQTSTEMQSSSQSQSAATMSLTQLSLAEQEAVAAAASRGLVRQNTFTKDSIELSAEQLLALWPLI